MKKIFQQIYDLALPYLDIRGDKGHTIAVTNFAIKLLKHENADEFIVVPAAILHDVGWFNVSKEDINCIFDQNCPKEVKIKVRLKHQEEGVKLAKEILNKINYLPNKINEILRIISIHDTYKSILSNEQGIVCDADKLWRYTSLAFKLDMQRIGISAEQNYLKQKQRLADYFYFESSRKIAEKMIKEREKEFSIRELTM